ncbi:MAG TPA: tetratricopeptide repeat protein [Phycisphaerales bacterium]|nr:tetratricopeptide repeat protein [Phycisphaerales bacterium]
MPNPRLLVPMLLLAAMTALAGCTGRSTLAVQEDADRAFARGQYAQAAADYEEFTRRLPGDAGGRYRLGRTYLKLNRPLPAREQLYMAYSQNPDRDEYVEALADALYAAGQHEEMYRVLRQRALDRGRPEDYLRLAAFAQKVGDADEARQALLTAARLDKGRSAKVQLSLADFYTSIGDRQNAVQHLRYAAFLAPTDASVQDRARALGEVPGPSFAAPPPENLWRPDEPRP